MKQIPLVLLLALLALPAVAQETYSVTINSAANVNKLDLGRQQGNASICVSLGLAATCSQSEACAVDPPVTGGASCTAADALAAGRRIYPNTLAGREGFVSNVLVKAQLDNYVRAQVIKSAKTLSQFCATANQTQADAICTASGQAAGCGVCDALK